MLTLPGSLEHQLKDLEATVGQAYNQHCITKIPIPARLRIHWQNALVLTGAQQRRPSRDALYLFKSITTMLSDLEDKGAYEVVR